MRGINDDEIEDFARLTLDHPWHVRFIELMPVGDMRDAHVGACRAERRDSRATERDRAARRRRRPARRATDRRRTTSVAGARGTIGVITPMTHTYCASCNRVRLTADGRLRTCLFGDHEVDLRDAAPRRRAARAVLPRRRSPNKPKEHELLQMKIGGLRALSQVGG